MIKKRLPIFLLYKTGEEDVSADANANINEDKKVASWWKSWSPETQAIDIAKKFTGTLNPVDAAKRLKGNTQKW